MLQQMIRFTKFGCNSVSGNFGPGDIARFDPAEAAYLVDVVHCARYVSTPAAMPTVVPEAVVAEPAKPHRRPYKKRATRSVIA